MKNMAERCEIVVKKWVFRGKKGVIGLEKYEVATNLERLNGAKRRFYSLKQTKRKV